VSVDVLDPAFARAEVVATERTEECLLALKETEGSIDDELAAINLSLREAHEALSRYYVDEAQRVGAETTRGRQIQSIADELRITPSDANEGYGLAVYRQQRIERLAAVETAGEISEPLASCRSPSAELATALVERRGLVREKQAEINRSLGQLQRAAADEVPDTSAPVREEAAEKLTEVSRVVASPVAGLTLGSSPYAHALSSAPPEAWSPLFNEAFGRGVMGNVDIAVKLNEEADFSVKGMRFDATKVAEVAAKVTTQAVLLGSRIAGVPGGAGGGDSQAGPVNAVASAQQLVAERRAIEAARRQAVSDFALSLIDSQRALAAGANVGREIEIVRSRLDTVLPLLRLDEVE
jgi:hypothetical protein